MDYRACFNCELLFEVTGVGEALCPNCGGVLEPHEPSQVFSVNAPPAPVEDSMDERTRMVAQFDPSLLESIPDPELERTDRADLSAHQEMTRVSPSGFGEGDARSEGRRAPEYRAATPTPSTHERTVPLGRGVQHVDAVGETHDTPARHTGEHERAKRDYRPASSRPPFRAPSEMGTGQRDVSYRAVDGPQMGDNLERNSDGATTVSEPRSREREPFRSSGTREFATVDPAAGQDNEQSGFTAVDSRDAHGGRRSIHRRKTSGEQRQTPVPVEIPLPAPMAASADDSMDRTRMLDVSADVVEKTEMLQQSDLDEAVRAAGRMVGGVPASEDEEEARTRVVRRSDEFDALLQDHGSQQLQRTEAVSPVALQAQPRGLPTPMPVSSPNPSPRQAPNPAPRRAARPVHAPAQGNAAGPSPLPRRGAGGTPAAGPSPNPRPSRRAEPVDSPTPMPSGGAPSPRPSGSRTSHADYFEAGIDEDVDLTDAIDAIVGDQLIQNLEAKRSTLSRQKHRRSRARAKWLLVLLPVVAIGLLLLILLPSGDESPSAEIDAGVVDTVDPTKTLLSALGRVGLELPRVRGTQSLDERAPYLAASEEALRTSFGSVMGLTSSRIPDHLLDGEPDKQWVKPLRAAIERDTKSARDVFILALDGSTMAGTMTLFGRSATQAGYERLALTFDRQEAGGGVGMMEFRLGQGKLPSAGGALIRIGKLGVHTRIESRDGRRLSEKLPEVSNGDDGNPDLEAVDSRMERLSRAHPLVRVAVLFVNRELPLKRLAEVMERVMVGPEKERFTSLRLVVR